MQDFGSHWYLNIRKVGVNPAFVTVPKSGNLPKTILMLDQAAPLHIEVLVNPKQEQLWRALVSSREKGTVPDAKVGAKTACVLNRRRPLVHDGAAPSTTDRAPMPYRP